MSKVEIRNGLNEDGKRLLLQPAKLYASAVPTAAFLKLLPTSLKTWHRQLVVRNRFENYLSKC